MKEAEVKARAFAMPLTSPAYPPGPYRFVHREFMVITYRPDPDKLRAVLPEPLEMNDEPPIAAGRELWGFPKKLANSSLRIEGVTLKGTWTGPAALSVVPHALAPVAELPVLEIVSSIHLICDLTLGLGRVAHDYLYPSPVKREPALAPATAGAA